MSGSGGSAQGPTSVGGAGVMGDGGSNVGTGGTWGTGGAQPTDDCPEPKTVEVPAWGISNSDVYVQAGDVVSIEATGTWMLEGEALGPDGKGEDCDGGLWVRVGKFFEPQCVGTSLEFTAPRSGYLWFFQKTISVGYDQQSGNLSVTIEGGNSCSGVKPEGMLGIFDDPSFDPARLEQFAPVCGDKIPVLFDTDSPEDPRVQAYVEGFMGGDPEMFMKKVLTVACATNYATPEEAAHHGNGSMRLVHYLGAQKFGDLGRPPHTEGDEEYWDFDLSFQVEELSDFQHYGPWGAVASTFLHETGHVMSPVGRVSGDVGMPRWLNETYADLLAYRMGYDGLSADNPENWVLYARTAPYCNGYNTGALFLDAINRHEPTFIYDLSAYIVAQDPNPWAGSNAAFQAVLGRTIDEAYAAYLAEYELELDKPVAECDYPNDIP